MLSRAATHPTNAGYDVLGLAAASACCACATSTTNFNGGGRTNAWRSCKTCECQIQGPPTVRCGNLRALFKLEVISAPASSPHHHKRTAGGVPGPCNVRAAMRLAGGFAMLILSSQLRRGILLREAFRLSPYPWLRQEHPMASTSSVSSLISQNTSVTLCSMCLHGARTGLECTCTFFLHATRLCPKSIGWRGICVF